MARTFGCGFLMGAADVVPGISGGTVALILGIYQRLVLAISRIDATAARLAISGRLHEAARHADLWFLISVAAGIGTGIASLASLMRYLLISQRTLTYAAFCGMILASALIVARRVDRWTPQRLGILLGAAVVALRIVTLPVFDDPPDSLLYLFLCGVIGISAMILPGISGAFLLVILQRYFYVVDKVRDVLHLRLSTDVLLPLVVFAAGCLVGLLSFSRVLKWLLLRHAQSTVAALCGFMLGAMYCLWPFQRDTTPQELDFKRKVFENVSPDLSSGEFAAVVLTVVTAFAAVLVLERVSRNRLTHSSKGS